jgi:hypothetical protein
MPNHAARPPPWPRRSRRHRHNRNIGIVVERHAHVRGEAQHVVAVGVQSGQQRSGQSERRPTALAGPWRRRVALFAGGDQIVVAAAVFVQLTGRQCGRAIAPGEFDRNVDLDQQIGQLGGPVLPGEVGDPSQLTQVVGVMKKSS